MRRRLFFILQANARFGAPMPPNMDRYMNPRASNFASSHDRSSSRDNMGGFHSQQQHSESNLHFMGQHMGHQQHFPPYPMVPNRFREPSPPLSASSGARADSFVFNVEGLSSPSWNCERLFNLLCLYGNVLRVRINAHRSDQCESPYLSLVVRSSS